MKANKYEIKGYIYITSEETIKAWDWFISLYSNTIQREFKLDWMLNKDTYKKIILTNNPNLPIQQLTTEEVECLKEVDNCEVEKLTLNSSPVRESYKLIIAKKK